MLSVLAAEFCFLTLSAGGVPRDFFDEVNVPWLKKGRKTLYYIIDNCHEDSSVA